jgi:hypothetical protein
MIKHNQVGAVSGIAISLVMTITILVFVLIFGVWAFMSRQDYKNNVDAKIQVAVQAAKQQAAVTENAEYNQQVKQPYLSFQGPEQYGSISFKYPKTWNAYINGVGASSSNLINGYFVPGILTTVSDGTIDFALRIQVLTQPYAGIVQGFTSQAAAAHGITANAYTLPLVPNTVGVEVSGPLSVATSGGTATMVILPERTNTIEIWTDGSQYLSDFNNVLASFSFSP